MKKWDIFHLSLFVVTILISTYSLMSNLVLISKFPRSILNSKIPIFIASSIVIIVYSIAMIVLLRKKKGGKS
jgi:hypothetical protein